AGSSQTTTTSNRGEAKRSIARARRNNDAEPHERECDEFLHGVPFVVVRWTAVTRRQSRERIYQEAKKGRSITCTTCSEVRGRGRHALQPGDRRASSGSMLCGSNWRRKCGVRSASNLALFTENQNVKI